jgi:hypothetical protein
VAGVDGGSFIGTPSWGGDRPTSNYTLHQGLRFPNGDYGFCFMIQTQNHSTFFPSLLRLQWRTVGRGSAVRFGHGRTWHGNGCGMARPTWEREEGGVGRVGPIGGLGRTAGLAGVAVPQRISAQG